MRSPMQLDSVIPVRAIAFLGQVLISAAELLRGHWQFRPKDLGRVMADCSARAVPIVTVVNVLVGAILAFVGAVAAIITAVVMAGRTGAAFAAELATMQANEEIDALEVLGLSAVDFLVLPRVLSLLLMMPLLYIYGCVTGLVGGMLVAGGMLDISPAAYLDRTIDALDWSHLGLGFSKSFVFGALIGMVGSYFGLYAERNAAGVGVATTNSVVVSIVGIIVLDAVFAVCANALGI
jgi:phospholipid/cholesterol/gamma-HCH transport system permease protein